MTIAYTKLPGLDDEKVRALVEPVLAAHHVDGVELIWRGDRDGKVLLLTIEIPGTQRTGEGITIDLCTDISRELSLLLDESDVVPDNYSLEVGSPGVERALYTRHDYVRFNGQDVKLKLTDALEEDGFAGQHSVRGTLVGIDDAERVLLQTDHGTLPIPLGSISSAKLVFSWNQPKRKSGHRKRPLDSGNKPHDETEQ
jgi:ribosome maturation factor RimP